MEEAERSGSSAPSGDDSVTARLIVAYEGSGLAGWQRQPNTPETVQQKLEEALEALFGQRVVATASGRTDAGVHALGQSVHLCVTSGPSDDEVLRSLVLGANAYLPPCIRVLRADRMPEGFHARKHARSKLYRYRWSTSRVIEPQRARYLAPAPQRLDVARMRQAAEVLQGRFDFASFARAGGAHQQSVRTVSHVELFERGDELRLEVRGEGFLRGMVRAIAGTLLEVGTGRRSVEGVEQLLGTESRPAPGRPAAGPNAPARGLTLVEVDYEAPWVPLGEGFPRAPDPRADSDSSTL
ncbi:MAG: tRNA pseudouridine(38-40) synthase TruA [Acidobacteriota bacterium]